jgi:hypothetical protein
MLFAMWIGLAQGKLVRKLAFAGLSVVYLVFWHALGTRLMYGQSRLAEIFIQDGIQMLAILAVLSGVMFCLRRWLGQIQQIADPEPLDASAQTRYSLFTALGMSTAGSLFMALFCISMEKGESESSTAVVAHILLMMTTFSLLLISTILGNTCPWNGSISDSSHFSFIGLTWDFPCCQRWPYSCSRGMADACGCDFNCCRSRSSRLRKPVVLASRRLQACQNAHKQLI